MQYFYKTIIDERLLRTNIYYNKDYQFNFIFTMSNHKTFFHIQHNFNEDGTNFIKLLKDNNPTLDLITLPCSVQL